MAKWWLICPYGYAIVYWVLGGYAGSGYCLGDPKHCLFGMFEENTGQFMLACGLSTKGEVS